MNIAASDTNFSGCANPAAADNFADTLPYRIGGLLYVPAVRENVIAKITEGKIPALTSVAFCLEDSVHDDFVATAEEMLKQNLEVLRAKAKSVPNMPLVFVRVRSPRQIIRLCEESAAVREIATGFILPKFDLTNAEQYISAVESAGAYMMPILESRQTADLATRAAVLGELKKILDAHKERVLNIRVGANDFCGLYGLRRQVTQTIYDIGVVRDILADILNVFAADYVVSAGVWNYFGADKNGAWAAGLRRELQLDVANGFVGKTVVHPVQLPLVYDSLRVTQEDYDDAVAVLNWQDGRQAVAKSVAATRMNELKCHLKWAERVKILGDIYGIKNKEL